jgi:hypothetical protein
MGRGPIIMAGVGVVSLALLALVFGGPTVLEKVLPDRALAWIEDNDGLGGLLSATTDMASVGGTTGGSGDDPASHLRDTTDGWRPSAKIAALPGNGAAFVRDVIDGRRASSSRDSPALVEVIPPMQGCSFTPPSTGSFVGHVSARGDSEMSVGLASYGDADLADAVRQLGRSYKETGLRKVPGLAALRFDAYDVAVTETTKPVYLVLQGAGYNRLWNLHLAPGAQLERVVLLGGDQAGVANLPQGVPVEVMRDAERVACDLPPPSYPLNPGFMLFQSLEAGHLDPDEAAATLAQIEAQVQAYDQWFMGAFGVSALQTMAGNWVEASIAVAGPVPATTEGRAVWRPVKGATARITADFYVEYDALTEQGVDFDARVRAIAESFAWGDLKNIKQGVEF